MKCFCLNHALLILLIFALAFASVAKVQGQSYQTKQSVDWNSMDDKGSSLYKYQQASRYPQLSFLYVSDYIKNRIQDDKCFEVELFPPLVAYQLETYKFEAVFRAPLFQTIHYRPTLSAQKRIKSYQDLMQSTSYQKKYAEVFENIQPITDAKHAYLYSHLDAVNLSWDLVPDAPKLGGKGFLRRRSAREAIKPLLSNQSYETQPNLEKVKLSTGPWVIGGTENIQLSQGYIDNWVKGGESSMALSSDLRLHANYKKSKHEWENYIINKVGIISTEDDKGRVNTDLIEINTKYGHKASKKWYYSFLYNFKTQLFYGYEGSDEDRKVPVSGFLAPAYMSLAAGMDYKPTKKFTLMLSPITSRIVMVRDTAKYDQTKYGISKDKNHNLVNGISVVNKFEYQISDEIKLSSSLDAFYQYLGKINEDENRRVQIDWEVILDMRINRFLSTRFLAHGRYFTNESERIQFRENFNISFKYNF